MAFMEYIALKTDVLTPPKQDIWPVLDSVVAKIQPGDLVLITSKIISIHQGRCVPVADADKRALIEAEAEYLIERESIDSPFPPLAITHFTILSGAGIDESNADGHYILLPERPFDIAEDVWKYLRDKLGFDNFGIVITDTRTTPMRYGSIGVALAWWGFHPIESHRGKQDLFGRAVKFSTTNIVDAVASGSAAVAGETNEATPVVLARQVPNLRFVNRDTRHEVFKSEKEDLFYPLLKPFYDV